MMITCNYFKQAVVPDEASQSSSCCKATRQYHTTMRRCKVCPADKSPTFSSEDREHLWLRYK